MANATDGADPEAENIAKELLKSKNWLRNAKQEFRPAKPASIRKYQYLNSSTGSCPR
jgi:hypothetical protein